MRAGDLVARVAEATALRERAHRRLRIAAAWRRAAEVSADAVWRAAARREQAAARRALVTAQRGLDAARAALTWPGAAR